MQGVSGVVQPWSSSNHHCSCKKCLLLHPPPQATLALLHPESQDVATQIQIRLTAAAHPQTAARLAGPNFARRQDLCTAACRQLAATVAGLPLTHDSTKSLVIAPLAAAAHALNGVRPADVAFQATFNCLLLDCLAAASRWGDALAHCRGLRRAAPQLLRDRTVAARAAAALARAGDGRVAEEVARLQADIVLPEVKVSISGGGVASLPGLDKWWPLV
jgi:hypothetical protein